MRLMTAGRPLAAGFGIVQEPGFGVAHFWSPSTEASCVRMDGPESPACAVTTGQPPAAAPNTPAATMAIQGVFPRIGRVLRSVGVSVFRIG
ncbi:hypothetical protein GCM10009735_54220 [Actinomadura chokoriensis]